MRKLAVLAFLTLTAVFFQNCDGGSFRMAEETAAQLSGGANGGGSGSGGLTTGGGTPTSANRAHFEAVIRPLFQSRCMSCHAEPRLGVTTPAPLTIYTYDSMRAQLARGGGITGNDLIRKVTNAIVHTGGNQCFVGLLPADPLCGKIMEWWSLEFGSGGVGSPNAQVTSISQGGIISGWATDPADPARKVRLIFYRDNAAGNGGTLIGEVIANGPGVGAYNGISFEYQIPANLIDNRSHQIYAYLENTTNLLPGFPVSYVAYRMSAAGLAHYNANIAPTIQSTCLSCHGFSVESGFANLLSPTPIAGGSPTNNNFIMNASGNGHPINGCPGGINAGLCGQIQQWWRIEFQ